MKSSRDASRGKSHVVNTCARVGTIGISSARHLKAPTGRNSIAQGGAPTGRLVALGFRAKIVEKPQRGEIPISRGDDCLWNCAPVGAASLQVSVRLASVLKVCDPVCWSTSSTILDAPTRLREAVTREYVI